MIKRMPARILAAVAFLAIAVVPFSSMANVINEEKEIYIARPLITEAARTQTGFYFNSMMFDLPNAVSRPNPQMGFQFTPGFTWSVLDWVELNVGFPLLLNPDETGDQELNAADANPALKDAPYWDGTPDFDMPGIQAGLKVNILGQHGFMEKKGEAHFYLAAGVMTHIALEKWATVMSAPKTTWGHSNSHRISPYITMAYNVGIFSPQLQLGATIRMPEEFYDPENPPAAGEELESSGYTDFFFNLALPFTFAFEHTIPMLEVNGIFGEEGSQIFITPAVSFMPTKSPALLSVAPMLPILDSDFRENEGFRFMVNFSYRLDMLSIPAMGGDKAEEDAKSGETPPAGW